MIDLSGDKSTETAELGFLRSSQIFSQLSPWNLEKILAKGLVKRFGPDSLVFRRGELGKALYVVRAGLIEILRPVDGKDRAVAFMGEGDLLCEVGVFTGTAHRSTARVPEFAEILVITWVELKRLFRDVPELAPKMCTALAQQLTGTMINLEAARSNERPLQGSLEFFEIGQVVQTLVSAGDRSGWLVVFDAKERVVGEILIQGGEVRAARSKERKGEEAFYELTLGALTQGSFSFSEGTTRDGVEVEEPKLSELIKIPAMTLLLEGARLMDELGEFRRDQFARRSMTFQQISKRLVWSDHSTHARVLELWKQIGKGKKLSELVTGGPSTELKTYEILAQLLEGGMIAATDPAKP